VSGDIARALKKQKVSDDFDADALAERVRERIKEILSENKDALKNNWRGKVGDIIDDMIVELEEAEGKFTAGDRALENQKSGEEEPGKEDNQSEFDELMGVAEKKTAGPYDPTNILAPWEEHEKDERGCLPGYHFDPKSGIGCIQTDCSKVTHAHYSFDGYCVCGTSGVPGEKPDDPNLECKLPRNHAGCPGCTYLCLKLIETCPELGG
jgi:hypothetical protein